LNPADATWATELDNPKRFQSRRLDALWHYDQYIANADGIPEVQKLWEDLKRQEQQNISRLKDIIKEHIEKDCF
jgi:hypothetical protein